MEKANNQMVMLPKEMQYYIRDKLDYKNKPHNEVTYALCSKNINKINRSPFKHLFKYLPSDTIQKLFTNCLYNKLETLEDMLIDNYTTQSQTTLNQHTHIHYVTTYIPKIIISLQRLKSTFDETYYGYNYHNHYELDNDYSRYQGRPAYSLIIVNKLSPLGYNFRMEKLKYIPCKGHDKPYPHDINYSDFIRPIIELLCFKSNLVGKKGENIRDYIDKIIYDFGVILNYLSNKYRNKRKLELKKKVQISRQRIKENANKIEEIKKKIELLNFRRSK